MTGRLLTADELCEKDTVIEVRESDFYKLPQRAQEMIRAYHHEFSQRGGVMRFAVSGYRWRNEIEPAMRER